MAITVYPNRYNMGRAYPDSLYYYTITLWDYCTMGRLCLVGCLARGYARVIRRSSV